MALVLKDRVLESSTSTGTGSFTLTGAQTGYQSFSAIGNGNTTYYTIQGKNPDGTLTGEWEVGIGTWSTGNTLSRDTVLSNSLGTTAKVPFSAGDKDVFCDYPASTAVTNPNPTDIVVNGITVGKGTGTNGFSVALGGGTLSANTTGINNTGVGSDVLVFNTTGNLNTAIGTGTLYSNTTGNYNTALGNDVLGSNTTGSNNTSVGVSSLIFNETGSNNTALGNNALYENTTASNNTAVGYSALRENTTATNNTAVGNLALTLNTTGANNTALGNQALRYNKSSSFNVAVGSNALSSSLITSGNINNVGIGYNALNGIGAGVATVTQLTAGSGYDSGYDGSGASLVYVSGTPIIAGGVAPIVTVFINGDGTINSVSIQSVGFGWTALDTVFTLNNADLGDVGSGATFRIASLAPAVNNTAIGYGAGGTQKTGSNSVHVGYNTSGTGSNQVLIGSNLTGGSADNIVVIGDTNITNTTLRGNVTATQFTGIGSFTNLTANGSLQLTGNAVSSANFATSTTGSTINIGTSLTGGSLSIGSTGQTGAINMGRSNSSGTIVIGGTTGTGAITLGQSTANQTVNIAIGANTSGTKTLNLGTAGGVGGITTITIGATAGTSTTTVNGLLKQQTYTVATLPTGSAGARSFVTNALAPTFGAAVVGGGAVGVPVYHDGTSWKVG